jgi:conjugative transfer signal peptidase TraF
MSTPLAVTGMRCMVISVRAAAAFLVGTIGAPFALTHSGLVLNTSPSVPVGLYRRAAASSKYIGFCLSLDTVHAALRAGLEPGRGDCAGGVAPILKPVVYPSPAHVLIYSERGFTFDGALMSNTAPKALSMAGVPLAHAAFGTYTSGAWAVSTFNSDSFDSRYFGPVDAAAIRFYATPTLTWH